VNIFVSIRYSDVQFKNRGNLVKLLFLFYCLLFITVCCSINGPECSDLIQLLTTTVISEKGLAYFRTAVS
jgi:hypothetical protein